MTNAFAFPCQKILKKHSDDEEIALILKDIENAKQGVMTFSKEVKKYMLQFIHARYDDNQEVMSLIEVCANGASTKLSIFSKSSNCKTSVILVRFLHAYGAWKVIGKTYGFKDEEEALTILIRLVKLDESVFKAYPEL